MEFMPLISVIIPVYRVEKYLDRCLQSVTGQTYSNLEILLVDDGSPDASGAICDRWAEQDSRIRVIHQQNRGGGAARNAALDVASGQWIGFVDSDDYISPDMYSYLSEQLRQGADIAECGYVETRDDEALFDGDENTVVRYTVQTAMGAHIRDTGFRQLIWNKLYRREVIGNIRFPEGTKIDDEFFTYQVLGNARVLTRGDKVLYAYRQQPESVMHQSFSTRGVEGLRAKLQRLAYIRERFPDLEQIAKADLMFSCITTMQQCLRCPDKSAKEQWKRTIHQIAGQAVPIQPDPELSERRLLLLKAGQKSLEGTARVLNLLMDIHILT